MKISLTISSTREGFSASCIHLRLFRLSERHSKLYYRMVEQVSLAFVPIGILVVKYYAASSMSVY